MPFPVEDLVSLHDAALERWTPPSEVPDPGGLPATLPGLFEEGHFANFAIWHLEDVARLRTVGDAAVAAAKRAIDAWNQRRNDLMEAVDRLVLEFFSEVDVTGAPLHSETAGMMIDRLSILALKMRNMRRVAEAASAERDGLLAEECLRRLGVLGQQREDLAACLEELLADFAAGRRYFRIYRQMKAYNDERWNPALRAEVRAGRRSA